MGIRDDLTAFGFNALGAIGGTMADLAKARRGEGVASGASETSHNPVPTEHPTEEQKALMWDPYSIVEQIGFKDRPSAISYGTLNAMLYKLPIIHAIIQTRVNQIASFTVPQKDRHQIGFKVKLRDHEKAPTKIEQQWANDMEKLIMTTGVCDDPRQRDSFETFARKVMFDSMTFDQMCIETVPNKKGVPCQWYATDAKTMRLADTASVNAAKEDDSTIKYVQIYDGMIINEFTNKDMYFGIRNPRTDIRLQGYGVSELEMLITTITSLLYAHDHNTNFFKQGAAVKGIINFKGLANEKMLQAFRRHWYTQVASTANAWKTPVSNAAEGLEFINMQTSSRDMEFNAWMDFLIKTAAAIFTIDPVEVNFQYGNTGQAGGLGESSNKEKITESKERGLRPLLRFLAKGMNEHIIWPINEDFELEFVGLDSSTKEESAKLKQILVKTYKTVDEARAEEDLAPLPDGKGDIILDPTWLQYALAKEGMGQEDGMQDEGGDDGGEQQGEEKDTEDDGGDGVSDDDYQNVLAQYEDKAQDDKTEKSLPRTWKVRL